MTRWTAIQTSDFALFARFVGHEYIDNVLAQRASVGFNLLRVWLLNTSVYRIVPSDHPDFYQQLRPFVRLCAKYGLYVEFTCFTQTQTLMPNPADQQRHLDLIGANLSGETNVLLSLVNENDQHDNRTAEGLRMPAWFLCSRGSNGADAEPPTPVANFTEYHTNGLSEWWRKNHNGMEHADAFHVPCFTSEQTRCPDQDGDVAHWEDSGACGALLVMGSSFHSASGKLSQLFQGVELSCAQAFVKGCRSVDLAAQAFGYVHRSDLESPTILRAYQRGPAIVRIRA